MSKNNKKTVIRIVLVSLYAILVMKLVSLGMPENTEFQLQIPKGLFLFFYLLFFNLNVEGSLFFDRYLNKKHPWYSNPQKRLFIQIGVIILWTFISIGIPFTAWYFINEQSLIYPKAPVIIFIGSIVFLIGFISISIAINFFTQWKASLLDAEYYKQEKLKSDYRVLQNQVNPHFLFNSLNVLISEIKHNPINAEDFTRKLSKVYRYVLQSKNHDLISLKKELEIIDSFIFLHKVRIADALDYSAHISGELLHKQLPPLTLQIVIENAIKHNVANEENVLKISIKSDGDNSIIISNNLQPRENTDSTYTGLSNLSKRYELLKKDGFTCGEKENNFVVTIPLIDE
ncbi:histidine kinase [Arenibacter sp. TNZ]|uniref:sensor histidine kinase n=1 Tax=Arenibacter TaxID=178469 RepID=UPI000CD40D4E|nr:MULTISPECIES: histidine kinase [Arenibacter]MCM4171916.1 histidine kinase [Arenibacter sp. TNZ]